MPPLYHTEWHRPPTRYLTLAANYPLRSIVDSMRVAVRSASLVLEAFHGPRVTDLPGYRAALVETSVPGRRRTHPRTSTSLVEALTTPLPPAEVVVTVAPAIRQILQAAGAP